jgi:hypothetical protein
LILDVRISPRVRNEQHGTLAFGAAGAVLGWCSLTFEEQSPIDERPNETLALAMLPLVQVIYSSWRVTTNYLDLFLASLADRIYKSRPK